MRRVIQDRMSTLNAKEISMPTQLINPKILIAVVKEFFMLSQLSQFMDQVNFLAELEHKRLLSVLGPGGLTRERAGFEVRDVHRSYYGRICPIQTPEGANIGLVNHLANLSRVNQFGFLETPYYRVKKGVVTSEVVWLDAFEEEKNNIAQAALEIDKKGKILDSIVEARIKGEPGTCLREELNYIDAAPHQVFSPAASLIPFVEHDDANRALMGSNMQRQAVPLIKPEAPLVGTGLEGKIAENSQQVIIAPDKGEVTAVDADYIELKTESGTKKFDLMKFKRSNQSTCVSQYPAVKKGQKVKKGDFLTNASSIDSGQLALGQNLLVAFTPWEGANFEDAVILSERVVRDDRFTSVHIEDYYCDVRDTKLGPEITTPDIPNVSEDKLRNLDEEGIVRIGTEVYPDDILVGKISPKGESELTSEERLLRAIFGEEARDVKDTSLTMPHGEQGRIIDIKISSREKGDQLEPGVIKRIQIQVAQLNNVQAGDKLTGRHGNKGVISQIRPIEDMPYLEDGTPVDVILNPLGVASRMNLGQILETHLGFAAKKLGYQALTPIFIGATEDQIKEELKKAGLPESGKVKLFDGRSGEPFKDPITVGYIYVMKLNHLVKDKIHMRSTGPYSLITQQPLGGKARLGGQRFGEMEVWALEGYGASHTLQEMLTIKSDDVMGRSSTFESIIRGEKIKKPSLPASFNVLVNEIKSLGLDVEIIKSEEQQEKLDKDLKDIKAIAIKLASPEKITSWSSGEVTKAETINYRTQRPEKDGLFSERIFGPTKDWECYCGKYKKIRYKGVVCDKCGVEVTRSIVRRERMGHINLAAPVAHIWFMRSVPSRLSLILDVPLPKLEKVVYYAAYIVTGINKDAKDYDSKKKELLAENIKPGLILNENEYQEFSKRFGRVIEVESGAGAIQKILENLNLKSLVGDLEEELKETKDVNRQTRILRRLNLAKSMIKSGIKPEWMIMTVLPVLPPDLRPMVALDGGRFATSDLNDLYRRVINRNNRLKKLLELKAPDVIVTNEKRMLQEAVDALIDNASSIGTQQLSAQRRPLKSLADMLRGKQGRFRQNLLGKRVDYSGRSVIVVGPELKLNECGLPKKMALELFRPFVINKVIERSLAHNIKNANRFIDQGSDEVWAILEEVIADKKVLLNRAPTLHRLSIQAFKPILIEGLAVRIPPLVCTAFNADFDGDQMAVHLPLSEEAQYEAREIMLSTVNLLKPASGQPIVSPTQDIVLGCYCLTRLKPEARGANSIFSSFTEATLAYEHGFLDLNAPIKILPTKRSKKPLETTYGRLIFNNQLPKNFDFVNETLNKSALSKIIALIIEKVGINQAGPYLNNIKNLGFDNATVSGITWAMNDLTIPKEKGQIIEKAQKEVAAVNEEFRQGLLTDDERKNQVILIWDKANKEVASFVPKTFQLTNPIYTIIDSKARGGWAQANQMTGMKGLVQNPQGDIIELPVRSSYKEGLDVLEYFISIHGARKGQADTALKTAEAGYLTRRLIDVAQDAMIREEDCQTKEGIEIFRKDGDEYGYHFTERLYSRTALENIKVKNKIVVRAGEVITREAAEIIDKSKIESVKVRSPITCKTLYGICSRCYGLDLGTNQPIKLGESVGIIAAQSIGEPGTQLTLRTFHSGGVAGVDITHGLPRVEEIFECRPPRGKAILAETDGIVESIKENNLIKIINIKSLNSKGKKAKYFEYAVPRTTILMVKVGEKVSRGQQVSEGSINLKELLATRDSREVERYIINEIQKIYVPEGTLINDKHIETIIRQMFSRVVIKEEGDTDFVIGDIVEKSKFLEVNRQTKKLKGEPAKAQLVLMGITQVSLSTESFLSAASFQETSRVLVGASISAKVDKLRGLKENVIIGRLIPAGIGWRGIPVAAITDEEEKEEIEEINKLESK
jgi:DNA-directed RNA polymerase subunit beta'